MIGCLKNFCLLSWLETFKDAVTTSNTMPQNSHSQTQSMTACTGRWRVRGDIPDMLATPHTRVRSHTLNCLSGMYSAREVTSCSCGMEALYGKLPA